jgi:hypothetical protein
VFLRFQEIFGYLLCSCNRSLHMGVGAADGIGIQMAAPVGVTTAVIMDTTAGMMAVEDQTAVMADIIKP